jgi:hypothetical protein
MSAYVIDFSDPLKNGFSIPAGGFNGPGGSNASTTLRLYGRGALEWGEAVDENLVRLAENFASASPPSVSVAGQMWAEVTYYYHNTTAGTASGWYFYDINSIAANKWTLLNGTGIVATVAPITPVIGQYYLDTGTSTLYGYYSLGRYEPAAFVPRSYISGTVAPNASTYPRTTIRVRDAAASAWVSPATTTAAPTVTPPTNPQPGQLWYNTTTGNLLVWTGTVWQEILGPTGASLSTASSTVDMGGFKIIALGTPTLPSDATTKSYVDTAVAGGGAGVFLPLTGGTVTGSVTINDNLVVGTTAGETLQVNGITLHWNSSLIQTTGNVSAAGNVVAGTQLIASGGMTINGSVQVIGNNMLLSLGGINITTTPPFGQISMGTNRIVNLGTPVSSSDATTKAYVDAAVAGGGGSVPVIITTFAGVPATYKAGDIAINASKIYIANASGSNTVVPPAGNWKQVFPAVYA